MTRNRRIGVTIAIVVGGLIALNLVAQALDHAVGGREPTGVDGSSYATKPAGLSAFATLLTRYGHDVSVQRGSLTDNPPSPDTTVFVIEPDVLTDSDAGTLVQFVSDGGRLVIGGRDPFYLHNLRDDPPRWSPDGQDAWFDVSPTLGSVREIDTAGQGAWTAVGSGTALVGDSSLALLTSDRVGRGTMLFLADPSAIQNGYLASADNAAFALALAGDRPVVFAEGVHGFGTSRGFAAIPGPWKMALLLVGVAGLAFVWSRARRFGPPDRRARELPPARAEYVRALSLTMERTRDRPGSFGPAQARARDQLARRAGLGPEPDAEALTRAARDFGCDDAEIAALFGSIGDDTQVLALGRASARVTGGDRGTV